MSTFFHGWRRKAGCVALVIAGWVMCEAVTERMRIGQVARGERTKLILIAQLKQLPPQSRPSFDSALLETQQAIYESFSYVRYVAIAGPLLLISACLILWKPRKRAVGTQIENTVE